MMRSLSGRRKSAATRSRTPGGPTGGHLRSHDLIGPSLDTPHEIDVGRARRGCATRLRAGTAPAGLRPDVVPGRWIIDARLRRKSWEVIVEPDSPAQLLVVVTAYPVES